MILNKRPTAYRILVHEFSASLRQLVKHEDLMVITKGLHEQRTRVTIECVKSFSALFVLCFWIDYRNGAKTLDIKTAIIDISIPMEFLFPVIGFCFFFMHK